MWPIFMIIERGKLNNYFNFLTSMSNSFPNGAFSGTDFILLNNDELNP